jgi:hypothetical protein
MHRSFQSLVSIFLFSFFTACTLGPKFVAPESDSFEFGETTYEEILAKFGKPNTEQIIQQKNHLIKMVNYHCQTGTLADEGWKEGIMAQRFLTFYFNNKKLIGHYVSSSYKDDATNFDVNKINYIQEGETTRNQVIGLMGPRYGECMYPLTEVQDERVIFYSYREISGSVTGGWKRHARILSVTYNANNGIVSKVDFSETTN